jgi:SAM-dependent methyltransferase
LPVLRADRYRISCADGYIPEDAGICRERLRKAIPDRADTFAFATYSGTETCFRPASFDSCFGTAVAHHIVDVPRFLRQVQALLKPGGFAFFMEPNHAFHYGLTRTLADIVADFLRYGTVTPEDIACMLNWMAEVHCGISNTGELEVLAEREDKHCFVDSTFLAWAREAGFDGDEALPCDPDPTRWGTVRNYLLQCELRPEAFEILKRAWPPYYRQYFGQLKPSDRSPSYLFWLKKGGDGGFPAFMPNPPQPVRNAPIELWFETGLTGSSDAPEITIDGWCLADRAIGSLQVSAGGARRRLPVYRPRRDVERAKNPDGAYPTLNALCSGFRGTIRLPAAPDAEAGIAVTVQAVFVGGEILEIATLTVAGDGGTQTFHRSVPP